MINTSTLLNRPSPASSVELLRYRKRFDADRSTRLLPNDQARELTGLLRTPQFMYHSEDQRVMLGRIANKHLGLVNHVARSFDWYLYRDCPKLVRRIKPWIIACGPRVHVFAIVRSYILSPQTLCDEQSNQHVPLTPHESRLSNMAYEAWVLGNIAHWVFVHPKGFNQETTTTNTTGTKSSYNHARYTLPTGWQQWPLESRESYLRQPLHKIGALMMSWIDKRATGTFAPHVYAFEDRLDEGGYYSGQKSTVHIPAHETLDHNFVFCFPGPSSGGNNSGSGGVHLGLHEGCETPDLTEPFELRQAKAVVGARLHMNRSHQVTIRSCHPARRYCSTSTISVRMGKYKRNDKMDVGGQHITVHTQFLPVPLPPTVIFLALGLTIDEGFQTIESNCGANWYPLAFGCALRKMRALHPPDVTNMMQAWTFIADKSEKRSEKQVSYAHNFLTRDLYPHIGLSMAYNREKAFFLGYMLARLLLISVGYGFVDSKDDYVYQRYDNNGTMWSSLQRQICTRIRQTADRALRTTLQQQTPFQWRQIFGEQKTSDQMACCLSKGTWCINPFFSGQARTGATLACKMTNYYAYASSVRRGNTASKLHRRSIHSRQVDEHQATRLCAIETPEREMCGIARFQAVGSTLSSPCSSKMVLALLHDIVPAGELVSIATSTLKAPSSDFRYLLDIDGRFVWRLKNPLLVLHYLRTWRQNGMISPHVGCELDGTILHVRTSPGRNLRLLINLNRWVPCFDSHTKALSLYKHTLPELLKSGCIEFIDAMEERALSIAFSFDDFLERTWLGERFSHMELDPSYLMGLTAGSLPFTEHNQSARSVLSSAMSKQTFSNVSNPYRLSTLQYILEYPQHALCETRVQDDFGIRSGLANSQMVDMVVVGTDFSMEDAWEFNQAAIDRGMFRTSLLRRYIANNKPGSDGQKQRFEKPGKDCIGLQYANYDKIQEDGLPLVGTSIETDEIIIARTYREAENNNNKEAATATTTTATIREQTTTNKKGLKHDDSIAVRDEGGIVQSTRSILSETGAYHTKEVVIRTPCVNEIGDKYYARHGQKATIGILRPEKDMYYSIVTGRPAHVHMNGIGLLARMTDGQLTEMHCSTAAAMFGKEIEATPFLSSAQKSRQLNIGAALLSMGAQRLCYEVHVNGMTGEMTQPLFRGMVAMGALAHLVGNKIHARNRGPRKANTRQPEDGRAKLGGGRFGQMEVDCFVSHGAARALKEKMGSSDEFVTPICMECGIIAECSRSTNYKFCRLCYQTETVVLVSMSYTTKLLIQELAALGTKAKLILTEEGSRGNMKCYHGMVSKPTTTSSLPTPSSSSSYASAFTYREFLKVPKPDSFEFKSVGIEEPIHLRKKIEQISAASVATAAAAAAAAAAASAAAATSTESSDSTSSKKKSNSKKNNKKSF